ncbi:MULTISPECIES: hypothetical protein [unclassified Bradyrhizobium]|uniref:hypothetical protein n=1 Tax=unclassified Bradyrhizobium TaxID=2631580 RepID=UPI002FF0FA61
MQLQEFKPENELETAIADTRKGVRPVADLMRIIARSKLFVSSKGEVQSDWSGFDPLLFENGGHPFVAVFSALSRPGLHSRMAEYVLQMNGREFFLRMPESYGVILNPGYVSQLIIPPTGVSEFRKDLRGG